MQELSLEGVRGKLDRADEHLETLQSKLKALVESDAYKARGQFENERTEYVIRVKLGDPVQLRRDLLRIGLIFGDGIQNLRTALDHLLCQLVIASGREPTKQNQFPIFTRDPTLDLTGRELRKWKRWTARVKSPYIGWLKFVQPYQADKTPERNPERNPLAHLADFSNADKHRIVLPAVFAVTEDVREALKLTSYDMDTLGKARIIVGRPLEDGAEILRLPVRVTSPNPHMEMAGHVPLDVAFGEQLVTTTGVGEIRDTVRMTVEAFRRVTEGGDFLGRT